MTLNLQLPEKQSLKPMISVFGVGGGGGNAVNNMIAAQLEGVTFVVANTDAQALEESLCDNRIQLGESITQGLGAGSYPEVGKASAEEALEEVMDYLQGCHMVFVTAGLGGGTGTGAAPVVARLAREQGILTVGVVTKPFHFEGTHRMRVAELGLQEMQKYVDTLIVIPNQNLFRVADKNTTFMDAFKLADDVLHSGVRGITDLMTMPGLINLDFSDVRSVMSEMGKAMMGTGEGEGDHRAVEAAEAAIANPLLDNVSMKGARGVLINITGGSDMTLFEVDEAANRIREEVDPEANIIFGSAFNKDLDGRIRVSVVATGIDGGQEEHQSTVSSGYAEPKAAPFPFEPTSEPQEEIVSETVELEEEELQGETDEEPEEQQIDIEEQLAAKDAFIAPEPVEPKTYPGETTRAEPESAPEMPFGNGAHFEPVNQPRRQPDNGFLGGLFGGKKPGAEARKNPPFAPVEEGDDAEEEMLEAAVSESPRGGSPKEDDLEIPAFLRRKGS